MENKLDFVPVSEWGIFADAGPYVIAGPCSAESEEQVMRTASQLREGGVGVLRAGLWKPRTRPGCFEGVGERGLPWLQRVQRELGLKVCTEVASAAHVQACLAAGIDMVWIGARTTTNPFLVQEVADALSGSDIPVLVKNPINPDLALWTGAVERLRAAGVRKVGVVLRGFSSADERKYRYSPQWQMAIDMRHRFPGLPFLCDPSHMAGCREYIADLSQRALNLGLDGLMVESHCCPAEALSDAAQQLTPGELAAMLQSLSVRASDTEDQAYREHIEQLRATIDELDTRIIRDMAERMDVSRRIGESKRESNVAILQMSRWDEVMEKVLADADLYGLDRDFVSRIFGIIHEESVREQHAILTNKD